MKKGSTSRTCGRCKRIVMWFVPEKSVLGFPVSSVKKVLDNRFVKENKDGSGHYYCMDCLRKMFPDQY